MRLIIKDIKDESIKESFEGGLNKKSSEIEKINRKN